MFVQQECIKLVREAGRQPKDRRRPGASGRAVRIRIFVHRAQNGVSCLESAAKLFGIVLSCFHSHARGSLGRCRCANYR